MTASSRLAPKAGNVLPKTWRMLVMDLDAGGASACSLAVARV
jgi:hypothetical protein